MARRQLSPDSVVRRLRADSASASAFSDPEAKRILLRAREARVRQDSALTAYKATATQRISMGLGAKRLGLEKLLFRGDNVAEISWRRDVGVRVRPVGSRMTVPMGGNANGDFSGAISIPYFPGRESLWFPSSNFGVVKSDIDEREVIHPLANGAEAYYKYATGDSVDITLDGGRVIKLRELRITARRPDWRVFVGSFWFDRDGGQLVRAAYRLAVDLEIWDVASEQNEADKQVNREADRLRDSIARLRMPRDVYVKDSIMRAPQVTARANNTGNDIGDAVLAATMVIDSVGSTSRRAALGEDARAGILGVALEVDGDVDAQLARQPGPVRRRDQSVEGALLERRPALAGGIRFLVGDDAIRRIESWHRWRELLALATPAVVVRPPSTRASVLEFLGGFAATTGFADARSWLLDVPPVDLASTGIRASVARGTRPEGLSDGVWREIAARGLYGFGGDR